MRLRNVFIGLFMLSIAAYGGFKAVLYFEAKDKVDKILAFLRMAGIEANYDRVATSIFGSVGVQGLKLTFPQGNEQVSFGEVMVHRFDQQDKQLPTHMRISFNDIKFNVRLFDELWAKSGEKDLLKEDYPNWSKLGYYNIEMDMDVDMKFLPAENEFMFTLTQDIQSMWDLRFFFDITDMPVNQTPAALGFKIKEIRIDYKDNSYAQRYLKWGAEKQGVDAATYQKKIIADFDADITAKKFKLGEESIQSIRAFLNKPDKLTISVNPYKPVAVGSIKHYDPADVPSLLNLRFSRN